MCAASMVKAHRKTVDIGTDHAYLPAYLILNGIAEDVLACDIGIKPLLNAEKTLKAYSLEDKIRLRVSDGLKKVSPDEAQEITICGMGGTLMSDILKDAPWIKKNGIHLVLQPMTHSEDVRRFLCENGFLITEENCVLDTGRVYCCIGAEFIGEDCTEETGFYYFGTLPPKDDISAEYVKKQLSRVNIKLQALKKAGIETEEVIMLQEVKDYYEKRMQSES